MLDGGSVKYLLGWRAFEICSPKSPEALQVLLKSAATANAPHGVFRDWPNSMPFMGIAEGFGFSLLEKTRFGQGWPAKLEGKFDKGTDQTIISVSTYPTKLEFFLLCAFYLIAPIFILIGIFISDSMTFIDRSLAIGIPVLMLAASWHDYSERAKRVKRTLTAIFQASTP